LLLNEFLERSADINPNKTALIYQDSHLTYSQIDNAANSLGNALVAEGLQRQDRVAIYLDNTIESVVSLFGVLKAGGVFLMINPQVKARKLEYILNDCQTRVLVTDTRHLTNVSGILTVCPTLESIILVDYDEENPLLELNSRTRILSYRKIVESNHTTRPARRCIDIDLASLIYTSGTTGNPKGVMLTHLNMVSATTSIIQYLENTSSDIIIDVLPLSFDYGLYQVLMVFKFSGTLILERSFTYPYQIIDLIIKKKVTGWPMVPTIVAILLTLKKLDEYDFSHLRYITSTGQALPPHHIDRLRQIFPGVRIYSMYGLTECKRVSYLPPEELDRIPSSVGKAMPNTEVYIVDKESKEITEARKPGELVVRGSNIMRGYWNLPEETAKALRPGRYPGEKVLYTGDLFEKDDQGYLYFIGRKDDMFKTSGELVSPTEVENALCECADIVEAAIVGLDDDILGQAIKAFIVLKQDSQLTEKDVIRFCSERLESYMVPRYVVFRRSLPRTTTGKIQKSDLK
jgi:amino acid adenylation domain-containing protein